MNAEMNRALSQMIVALEGAGRERTEAMKCEACGEKMMASEVKKAGDGKMLCEGCWGKMHGAEVEEAAKPKLGSGKRFKNLVKALDQRDSVDDPEALAAWIGRMKYGAKKFNKMAQAGRK